MSARAFVVFIAVLAVVGLLGYGLVAKGGDPKIEVGKPLATASLPYLAGANGEDGASVESASVADYRGKWVLLNFWASWCAPCRDEAPALESFFRRHRGDGVVVLGVDSQDNTDDAAAFVKELGLTYPSLHDGSGSYHDDLNMSGYPESVLIDPQGDVAYYQPGPFTEKTLGELVEPLVEGRS